MSTEEPTKISDAVVVLIEVADMAVAGDKAVLEPGPPVSAPTQEG